MTKLSIDELNRLYTESDHVDHDIFAEQRSNILLVSGDHYSRYSSKFWNRIRESRELSQDQKLRLTKNHIQKISKSYINNIISQAPGVIPVPNNPKELQDQKAAELNKAVWQYAKVQHGLKMKTLSWAKDFIDTGEVAVKIFWNPLAGRFLGYEQSINEEGEAEFNDDGSPKSNGKAVFSGDLVFEKIYGFNLLRAPEAKTMHESRYLTIRKMVQKSELEALIGDDEEKKKKLTDSRDETFLVFDGSRSMYNKTENQVLLKEVYFRPCYDYPNGYFYFHTDQAILFEGELPFGIFPIVYEGFDEVQTTPRHRSVIKTARPYQIEINRASSKIAEHQITLGDDKIILQNGSKMTSGPSHPGIRVLYATGGAPTLLEGRTGDQYLGYVQAQISEMYSAVNLMEDSEEKDQGADPFASLYKSIRHKKKFVVYAEKFINFHTTVCKTYLDLAKNYFDENMLIPAIGRSEYINIVEFKSQEPLSSQIKIEEMSDDIETQMGRHLVLNHILQYVGQNLEKDDIGKIIRQMPFANHEETYSDLTLNYDTATNIILALDRGELVVPSKRHDDQYVLKRLEARRLQSDYQLLDPQIRANYDQIIEFYEQIAAEKAQEIKMAQSEFIPSGGAMIKVDYYVPDPTNKTRSIRATLPAESVDWLIKQLSNQGTSQDQFKRQTSAVQADIARKLVDLNTSRSMDGSGLPIENGRTLQ